MLRSAQVLIDTPTLFVHSSEVNLGGDMTLVRRFAEPRCGLYFVPRYTETVAIHDGNVQLRHG